MEHSLKGSKFSKLLIRVGTWKREQVGDELGQVQSSLVYLG